MSYQRPFHDHRQLVSWTLCRQEPSMIEAHPLLNRRPTMAKPHRKIKKANHGARPANSRVRKSKRQRVKT